MADIRTTIIKSVFGNRHVTFGTATYVNVATSSSIRVDLHRLEAFIIPRMVAYTFSNGVVTFTHTDPGGSAGVVGWMAIGL